MKLKIDICIDNDAFSDISGIEVARILRKLAAEINGVQLNDYFGRVLMDANGNKVGLALVTGQPKKGRRKPT